MRTAKVQMSQRKCAVSSKPSLFALYRYGKASDRVLKVLVKGVADHLTCQIEICVNDTVFISEPLYELQ